VQTPTASCAFYLVWVTYLQAAFISGTADFWFWPQQAARSHTGAAGHRRGAERRAARLIQEQRSGACKHERGAPRVAGTSRQASLRPCHSGQKRYRKLPSDYDFLATLLFFGNSIEAEALRWAFEFARSGRVKGWVKEWAGTCKKFTSKMTWRRGNLCIFFWFIIILCSKVIEKQNPPLITTQSCDMNVACCSFVSGCDADIAVGKRRLAAEVALARKSSNGQNRQA